MNINTRKVNPFRLGFNIFIFVAVISLFACNQEIKVSEQAEEEVQIGVKHPEWSKNANIYEVNIRQYTPEGTLRAFEDHLPRLREMGVDILWLMPIHPIGEKNRKGTLGSYYAVQDYKKVNPEYGSMDDFKTFVQKAHNMGFKVILDWVANHSAWDNPWIYNHPEYYATDSTGQMISPFDWTDVAKLNYDNPDMRAAMIDALKFWVEEADIDGYRCDVAAEVPTDFWDSARVQLDVVKPVFMLAEAEKLDHHQMAFDMSYAWELHHIYNEIAKGKMNANDIDAYYQKMDTTYDTLNAYRMNFITNHDENSWNGTVTERMGKGAQVFAMLTYTLPGMPLIYSGQEVGLDKRLEFFEKDEINWNFDSPWLPFYTKMIALKHNNKVLWNGGYGAPFERIHTTADEKVIAFKRVKGNDAIIVIANLSNEPVSFQFAQPIMETDLVNIETGEPAQLNEKEEMIMEPWGYFLLKK